MTEENLKKLEKLCEESISLRKQIAIHAKTWKRVFMKGRIDSAVSWRRNELALRVRLAEVEREIFNIRTF